MQVMLPFLVAGLGMVGAGLVLDLVQVSFFFFLFLSFFFSFRALLFYC